MAKRSLLPKKIFGISSTLVLIGLAVVAYMKNWGGLKDKISSFMARK